ncbi:MAG TPA: DUF2076 family protein, partial [Candidatus Sulfotelmatobacter sp.]|nr:DUF2076 family protein [Candidatus Sulfotelmatobacter sp.]
PPPAPAGGPWGRRADPAPQPQYYQPQPAYQQPAYPQPAYGQPGGGFLRSALSTAAGFAGGALLFQGIERMLGYGASPFGPSLGGWGGTAGYAPVGERETIVNNYYGDNAGSGPGPDISDASDPGDQQNYDDQSSGGFDDGGGGGFDDNGGSVDV